ncbi:Uncharacterised protein [Legionella londiniensis]|nr:Uncharacterised protein [Legionella londiniensis]
MTSVVHLMMDSMVNIMPEVFSPVFDKQKL